ncbi:MAG: hypothetical protein ACFFC7_21540 [Candidatus Hermodarchaeota archaeon]
MTMSDFIQSRKKTLIFANRLQFFTALALQLVFPLFIHESYRTSNNTLIQRNTQYFFYQQSSTGIFFSFSILLFLAFCIYFLIVHRHDNYFELLPLSLIPILVIIIFSVIVKSQDYIPSLHSWYFERVSPQFGLIILVGSISISLAIFLLLNYKDLLSYIPTREQISIHESQEEFKHFRLALSLFIISLFPITATIPIRFLDLSLGGNTFFLIPHEYLDYQFSYYYSTFFGFQIQSAYIGSGLLSLILEGLGLVLGILALYDFKTEKKNNFIFILLILWLCVFFITPNMMGPVNLLTAIFILSVAFPFFLLPYWMVAKGDKEPEIQREGLVIIVLVLSVAVILFLSAFFLPIHFFELEVINQTTYNSEIRPTLMVLIIPFIAKKLWEINHKTKR